MYVFPASFSKGLHAGFSHASWSNIHGSRGKRFALLFVLHSGFVYARCTLAFFRACTSRYHNHNASILNARPRATKTRRVRGNVEEKAKINRSESFGLAVVRCSGFGYTPYSIRVQLTPHTGRPTWCAPVRAGWRCNENKHNAWMYIKCALIYIVFSIMRVEGVAVFLLLLYCTSSLAVSTVKGVLVFATHCVLCSESEGAATAVEYRIGSECL